jgi:hypothetical protein
LGSKRGSEGKMKARQTCQCGRKISPAKIEESYVTGKLLFCTKCKTFTSAVAINSVSGSFRMAVRGTTEVLIDGRDQEYRVRKIRGN